MYAKDLSPSTFPESGNRSAFHGASHHANVKANMDNFAVINKYHVAMLRTSSTSSPRRPMATAPCLITR
jgi:hypothetical protein